MTKIPNLFYYSQADAMVSSSVMEIFYTHDLSSQGCYCLLLNVAVDIYVMSNPFPSGQEGRVR